MKKTDWRQSRCRVKALLQAEGSHGEVFVQGWLRTVRSSKGVAFLALNDGSCLDSLQIVVGSDSKAFEVASRLGTGSCVGVRGQMVASPGAGQSWEVQGDEILVYGDVDESFPLQKKRHGFEFLRTIAHLRPRTNAYGAVFRVRSRISHAVHTFFQERGFVHVHTPIITSNDCEGAGEMFRVTTLDPENPPMADTRIAWHDDFFGTKTGLTVSGQLQAELFATAFTDVYTFGPTFRAENSNTSRHASEFWMIEPEIAFADLADNCQLAEDFFRFMVAYALEHCREDLEFFNQFIDKGLIERLERVVGTDFQTMTYTEAVERLQQSGQAFEFPVEWGCDLQSEHERYLTEKIVDGPLFVTDYPKGIKAFYMRNNDDGRTVAAMDLLVPKVGEIIGGSQREERLDVLEQKMKDFDIHPESLDWYLDTRRWGSCPHAGFGLGFERFLMYITGMENVRDVIPFPRTPGNARF
ncbi:asparagine--tRNA ligase [Deltaproteobacteria bacterium IMCC39524]|nr:asparagine--tRNA ligase [Deltaproteobacteria bacterium IMCC39524]